MIDVGMFHDFVNCTKAICTKVHTVHICSTLHIVKITSNKERVEMVCRTSWRPEEAIPGKIANRKHNPK